MWQNINNFAVWCVWGLFWALDYTSVTLLQILKRLKVFTSQLWGPVCSILCKLRFSGPCQTFYNQTTSMWQKVILLLGTSSSFGLSWLESFLRCRLTPFCVTFTLYHVCLCCLKANFLPASRCISHSPTSGCLQFLYYQWTMALKHLRITGTHSLCGWYPQPKL